MASRAARAGRVAVSLAVGLLSLGASVAAADFLFRVYERHFLVQEVEIGATDFDLAALKYNDADGYLPAAEPAGEFRILSFGDSFAESATLPQYAYAHVLQRLLTQASGRPVRVVNFGTAVTTFQDYLAEERSWGRRAEHDAVIFNLYAGNDFAEAFQYELYARGISRAPVARGEREVRRVGVGVDVPHRFPLRMLDHLWAQYLTRTQRQQSQEELALYRPDTPFLPEPSYISVQAGMTVFYRPDLLAESYTGSLYWLDALIRRAAALERAGKRVAITLAPPDFAVTPKWLELALAERKLSESDLRFDLPAALVASLAARHGFGGPLIVFQQCLHEAELRGEDTYYGTNTHWTARGNEIVGRVLAERLAQAWDLGAGKLPPAETEHCSSDPPPRDLDVERFLDRALPTLEAALKLRDRVRAGLGDERHQSFDAIASALARAGLRHAPDRVTGGIDSASAVGLRHVTVRLYARARDLQDPASWLLVLVFRSGRLHAIGMAPADNTIDEGNFYFDLAEDASGPVWGRDTLAVAITPTGEFAEIPVAVGAVGGGLRSSLRAPFRAVRARGATDKVRAEE